MRRQKGVMRMNEKKTVYVFYLVKDFINPDKYPGIIVDEIQEKDNMWYALYAFTDVKAYAKLFRHTRKKSLFHEKQFQMSKEEYVKFCDKYDSHLLANHTYITKEIVDGTIVTAYPRVLSTRIECDEILFYPEMYISNYLDIDTLTDKEFDMLFHSDVLLSSYKDAIESLFLYDILCKLYQIEETENDLYIIDELGLYIRLYGNTLSLKNITEWGKNL